MLFVHLLVLFALSVHHHHPFDHPFSRQVPNRDVRSKVARHAMSASETTDETPPVIPQLSSTFVPEDCVPKIIGERLYRRMDLMDEEREGERCEVASLRQKRSGQIEYQLRNGGHAFIDSLIASLIASLMTSHLISSQQSHQPSGHYLSENQLLKCPPLSFHL